MKRIRIVESEIVEYFCDICGCKIDDPHKLFHTCSVCGRLACKNNRETVNIGACNSESCCDICLGMGDVFMKEIRDHEKLYEQMKRTAIDNTISVWKRRSLEYGD